MQPADQPEQPQAQTGSLPIQLSAVLTPDGQLVVGTYHDPVCDVTLKMTPDMWRQWAQLILDACRQADSGLVTAANLNGLPTLPFPT